MIEWFLLFLAVLFSVVAIFGSFLPVIPGPPLSFASIILLHFSAPKNKLDITTIILYLVLAVIITILDYIIPIWGTKKFGGTKYGVWGSTLGLVIGLFFGPMGIIFGPFLGALVGEILAGRDSNRALYSAWGTLVGFVFSTGIKLLFSLFVATFVFSKIIVRISEQI